MARKDVEGVSVERTKWLPDERSGQGPSVWGEKINPLEIPGHMQSHELFDRERQRGFYQGEVAKAEEGAVRRFQKGARYWFVRLHF